MPDDIIVGAGVCGLTLAHELSKVHEVLLVEREDRVGGLARTFRYGDYGFDIGPHRFHTNDKQVLDFINSVLQDDRIQIERSSGVYLSGRYHTWPLRPGTIFSLPPKTVLAALFDLFGSKRREIRTFEDYIEAKYGHTLYDVFFRGYTRKFVLTDPGMIHPLWAQTGIDRAIIDERQQVDSLFGLLKTTFLAKNVKTLFIYPPRGIDAFPNRLASKITANKARIRTGSEVTGIELDGDSVRRVEINGEKTGLGRLYWTAPITALTDLLGFEAPDLEYLSTVIYNIELRGEVRVPFQWCYFRDDDVPFVRSTSPTLFSRRLAPDGHNSLCLEVTCKAGDAVWNNPERLKDDILAGIAKTGLASGDDVLGVHVEKVRETYPLYKVNFQEELKKTMDKISAIKNLTVLGRCGRFWYNNMDHSIKDALQAARKNLQPV
jgi:protoporphyrinogen oxidase